MRKTAMERFTEKVNYGGPVPAAHPEAGPCHLWTAALFTSGYGVFQDVGKAHRAHRWLWRAINGEPPEGSVLDHWACDTHECVNLDHLRPVTHRENALRSDTSRAATNRARSECANGHPFDAANTKVDSRGYRSCITCARRRTRDYMRRQRATLG
jgi:hypothetical protein